MQDPLHEKIGVPELLVGREEEFQNFDRWPKNMLPAFLSLGGFTPEAQDFCQRAGIMTAERIVYVWKE